MGDYFRQCDDKDKAKQDLAEVMQSGQTKLLKDAIEKLGALPLRDGDLDLQAMGSTPEEWTGQFLKDSGASVEDILQSFLDTREP